MTFRKALAGMLIAGTLGTGPARAGKWTCPEVPLRLAAQRESFDDLEKIMSKNTDAACKDTALMAAVLSGVSILTLEHMRKLGADPERKSIDGKSVHEISAGSGGSVRDGSGRISRFGIIPAYLESVRAGDADPVSKAFEAMGILKDRSECAAVGSPKDAANFFVEQTPFRQRPELKQRLLAAEIFHANWSCPEEASKRYVDAAKAELVESGDAYAVRGVKVLCCK